MFVQQASTQWEAKKKRGRKRGRGRPVAAKVEEAERYSYHTPRHLIRIPVFFSLPSSPLRVEARLKRKQNPVTSSSFLGVLTNKRKKKNTNGTQYNKEKTALGENEERVSVVASFSPFPSKPVLRWLEHPHKKLFGERVSESE